METLICLNPSRGRNRPARDDIIVSHDNTIERRYVLTRVLVRHLMYGICNENVTTNCFNRRSSHAKSHVMAKSVPQRLAAREMPGILQACLQLKLHSDQELMAGRDSRDNEKK